MRVRHGECLVRGAVPAAAALRVSPHTLGRVAQWTACAAPVSGDKIVCTEPERVPRRCETLCDGVWMQSDVCIGTLQYIAKRLADRKSVV